MKLRLLLALSLLFPWLRAQAALRGDAVQANAAAATTVIVNVSGIGIQPGDVVLCFAEGGGGTSHTFTFPSGFTRPSGLSAFGFDGNTYDLAYKIAGTEPSSYTISYNATDFIAAECRVYSGRNTAAPFTAVSTTAQTSISGASPWSLPMTGLTAAAADDIVLFVGTDNNEISATTYTLGAPASWANALTASAGATFGVVLGGADLVNAIAGATGTVTPTLTSSGGGPAYFGGYMLSLAAAGSACTHNFWSGARTWAQPNGTTGSFWNLATRTFSTPNCSTGSFWRQDGQKAAN